MLKNPFVTYGYEGPEYFCDRVQETESLTGLLQNGNNVVLMSPRRMGKTGLLMHSFGQAEVAEDYNTFLIDIYATSNLQDLVFSMGKAILSQLMPRGQKALSRFVKTVSSLRPVMSVDIMGNPNWSIEPSRSEEPSYSLDQIFKYLSESDKPNIVAIDEFQQIVFYPEKNVEAVLRTLIQRCKNTVWVFSGSSRLLLSEMFISPARPFYASTTAMSLESLPCDAYADFSQSLFGRYGKSVEREVPEYVYKKFEGVTWFMQRVMNRLFSDTPEGADCTLNMVDVAVKSIIDENSSVYSDLLYQLTGRQKELLMAINRERKATAITSGKFVKKYALQSPSTVQTAIKSLVDRQIVTKDKGVYEVYDKFFSMWLETHMW